MHVINGILMCGVCERIRYIAIRSLYFIGIGSCYWPTSQRSISAAFNMKLLSNYFEGGAKNTS